MESTSTLVLPMKELEVNEWMEWVKFQGEIFNLFIKMHIMFLNFKSMHLHIINMSAVHELHLSLA